MVGREKRAGGGGAFRDLQINEMADLRVRTTVQGEIEIEIPGDLFTGKSVGKSGTRIGEFFPFEPWKKSINPSSD